ncbi:hypothetical protein N8261_04665 [Flavobacteriaceae bacterium]|nr:hypothetical protein [Flavobacteriaceae bacterium]|tara:strand:- start:35 stop:718 length:684 start_codon:yes stop_codon:yes gene_type:complete
MNIFDDLSSNTLFDASISDASLNLNEAGDIYFRRLLERNFLSSFLLENQSVNGVINGSLNDDSKYKTVLSDEGRNALKTIQYRKGVCKNDHCPITQEKFKARQKVTILPCKHGFTPESIDEWLEKQRAECPMCRLQLDSKEIKNDDYVENPNIQESRNSLLSSLNVMNSITNPFGRNISINFAHPFGTNQIHNTIPHSYINSNVIMTEEEALNHAIANSLTDISGNS